MALVASTVAALIGVTLYVRAAPSDTGGAPSDTGGTALDAGGAVADFLDSAHSAADGASGLRELAATLETEEDFAAADLAQIAYLSTPDGLDAAMANDDALDGRIVTIGGAQASGEALRLIAARNPKVKVYFVNGVLTTSVDAAFGAKRVAALVGEKDGIGLFYNHSILEPRDYQYDNCAKAVAHYYEARNEQAKLNQIMADVAHGNRAAAIEELTGLAKIIDKSYEGLTTGLRRGREIFQSYGRTAGEKLVTLACWPADAVINRHLDTAGIGSRIAEFTYNNLQAFGQWTVDADRISATVNQQLVQQVEDDITAGYGVVLIGYSQGTLFIRNALEQVNAWFKSRYGSCPKGGGGTAPIGAMYIAPAFRVSGRDIDSGQERYVMLPADIIHEGLPSIGLAVGTADANVTPLPEQNTWNFVKNHFLNTYLLRNSASRAAIQTKVDELRQQVARGAKKRTSCPDLPPDRHFEGEFVSWSNARFPVTYSANHIELTIHGDGSVTGSYEIAYSEDLTDSWETPQHCILKNRASGKLTMSAGPGTFGEGKIEDIQESRPDKSDCPIWDDSYSPSRLGWRLNSVYDDHVEGGVDVYQRGRGFSIQETSG